MQDILGFHVTLGDLIFGLILAVVAEQTIKLFSIVKSWVINFIISNSSKFRIKQISKLENRVHLLEKCNIDASMRAAAQTQEIGNAVFFSLLGVFFNILSIGCIIMLVGGRLNQIPGINPNVNLDYILGYSSLEYTKFFVSILMIFTSIYGVSNIFRTFDSLGNSKQFIDLDKEINTLSIRINLLKIKSSKSN